MNSESVPYTAAELDDAYSADTLATEARARAVLRYAGRLWVVTSMRYDGDLRVAEAVAAVPEKLYTGKRCDYLQRCALLDRMECRHPVAATLRRQRFYEGMPARCGAVAYRLLKERRRFMAGVVAAEQAELFGADA